MAIGTASPPLVTPKLTTYVEGNTTMQRLSESDLHEEECTSACP